MQNTKMNITSLLTVCKYIYNKINYNLANSFYNPSRHYNTNTNILHTNLIHKSNTNDNIQKYNKLVYNSPGIPIPIPIHIPSYNTNISNTIKTRNNKILQQTNQSTILLKNTNTNTKQHLVEYKKDVIPKRIKELVWTTYVGEVYFSKCYIVWCNNIINVFNYHTGHDIPNSKGGTLDIQNLKPICSNCNLSMGNKYTICEWNKLIKQNTT